MSFHLTCSELFIQNGNSVDFNGPYVLECGHWCCDECMSTYEKVHAAKLKRLKKTQKPPVCFACRAKRNAGTNPHEVFVSFPS